MQRTRLEQREDMKRFALANPARSDYKVSKKGAAKKLARDAIELRNWARDGDFNLEDLM